MKRTFNFRAFDLTDSRMGDTLSLEDASYEGFPFPFTDKNGECNLKAKYVVMQSTGYHDSHDQEIYEGDILQDVEMKVMSVEFGKYITDNENNEDILGWMLNDPKGRFYAFDPQVTSAYTIVGNIYENPELID